MQDRTGKKATVAFIMRKYCMQYCVYSHQREEVMGCYVSHREHSLILDRITFIMKKVCTSQAISVHAMPTDRIEV